MDAMQVELVGKQTEISISPVCEEKNGDFCVLMTRKHIIYLGHVCRTFW